MEHGHVPPLIWPNWKDRPTRELYPSTNKMIGPPLNCQDRLRPLILQILGHSLFAMGSSDLCKNTCMADDSQVSSHSL